jgi:proteasome accessory factor C
MNDSPVIPPAKTALKLDASDRVTLYLSLVPFLLENSPVTVTEAAERFTVTPKDLRDLVSKLANLGVPGTEGYYLPNDLFEINFDLFEDEDIIDLVNSVGIDATPRFSGPEAASLVAGLHYISGLIAAPERSSIIALMEKIGMGASAKPSNILVSTPEPPVDISILRRALATSTQVSFGYRNAGGVAEIRSVSPLRLDLVGDTWYLRGWCHLRSALRTFRLDRMSELAALTLPAASPVYAENLSATLFDERDTDLNVVVRLAQNALSLIAEYHPVVMAAAPNGDVLATIRFASVNQVPRLIASYPELMSVVEPPEAARAVVAFARDALHRYS